MANTEDKFNPSLYIFGLLERNLPAQDADKNTQPINGREFYFWMIGITGAFFLLRHAFLLLF
jgi:hypothetical protein